MKEISLDERRDEAKWYLDRTRTSAINYKLVFRLGSRCSESRLALPQTSRHRHGLSVLASFDLPTWLCVRNIACKNGEFQTSQGTPPEPVATQRDGFFDTAGDAKVVPLGQSPAEVGFGHLVGVQGRQT